jgi:ferrous iron transport protein B
VAALQREQVPMVVVLNMMDRVGDQGRAMDAARLAHVLGVPVVEATGIHAQGTDALKTLLDRPDIWQKKAPANPALETSQAPALTDDQQAQAWLAAADMEAPLAEHRWSRQLDRWLLHPVVGTAVLLTLLFLIFQAVFAWAEWPMGLIEEAAALLAQGVNALLPDGLLKGLLVDGVIAGVGVCWFSCHKSCYFFSLSWFWKSLVTCPVRPCCWTV